MQRTRTIHWNDPTTGADKLAAMNGLEYLQSMLKGELPGPPLLQTLDLRARSFEAGKAVFSFIPQEFHYNPIGSVHGGVISAILDSAMGCSLQSLLPAGTAYTTLELKINFLKAVTLQSGELIATGKVIHSGSRTGLVEAQLTDEQGRIYAHGTSTCMILKY